MFNVTVVNLTPDARATSEGAGALDRGMLSAEELVELLNNFTGIDAVQNAKDDPEIRVQSRRERFVIRTGQNKLFLQDARNLLEPAYVLTATEIIAELDGSAAAKRTTPPMPIPAIAGREPASVADSVGTDEAPVPVAVARPWPFGLIGLVLVLAGYIAFREYTQSNTGNLPALTPLTQTERLAEDSALLGVYMTGSAPGQHGIVFLGDGKLKLFQVNAQAAPGVVYGTYKLGRLNSKICLATDQPGGLITLNGRDSLEFCGEKYERIP